MAKKNYTNAGARRACKAIAGKVRKLHADGYISAQKYISLISDMKRLEGQIK